jgi:hypothetical protein
MQPRSDNTLQPEVSCDIEGLCLEGGGAKYLVDRLTAYTYYIEIPVHAGNDLIQAFTKAKEYFLPYQKIAINKYGVFATEIPRNTIKTNSSQETTDLPQGSRDSLHGRHEPITLTQLSSELMTKIEEALAQGNSQQEESLQEISMQKVSMQKASLQQVSMQAAAKYLENDAEYQALFNVQKWRKVMVGNKEHVVNEQEYQQLVNKFGEIKYTSMKQGFWQNYRCKGNQAIKKAMLQYIVDGAISSVNMSLAELVDVASKLTPIEKESLQESINHALLLEDEKLSLDKKRLLAIKAKEKEFAWDPMIFGGLFGLAGTMRGALDKNLKLGAVCGMLGYLVGAGVGCVVVEYEKYNENILWDEREKRLSEIFSAIGMQQENREDRAFYAL